jgi:heme-degrading monooxygenase HmoA
VYVVVFEFALDLERGGRYFELAKALRPEVATIDGFVSVERFESLSRPGHYVSISFWRDAEAIARWRQHAEHRKAQEEAMERGLFRDFRITVAEVARAYTLEEGRKARATGWVD